MSYDDSQAWSSYFKARQDSLRLAWNQAKGAYKTFRQVRADLHLPLVSDADNGGWSASLNQEAVDLQEMSRILMDALADVMSGARGVYWDSDSKDFFIERLPSDKLVIGTQNGTPVLVDVATDQAVRATGQVSAPAVGFLASLSQVLQVEDAAGNLRAIAEQKTLATLGSYRQTLLNAGDGASEESKRLLEHAIADGSRGVFDAANTKLIAASAGKPVSGNGSWTPTEKILFISASAGIVTALLNIWKNFKGRD